MRAAGDVDVTAAREGCRLSERTPSTLESFRAPGGILDPPRIIAPLHTPLTNVHPIATTTRMMMINSTSITWRDRQGASEHLDDRERPRLGLWSRSQPALGSGTRHGRPSVGTTPPPSSCSPLTHLPSHSYPRPGHVDSAHYALVCRVVGRVSRPNRLEHISIRAMYVRYPATPAPDLSIDRSFCPPRRRGQVTAGLAFDINCTGGGGLLH